MSNIDSLKGVAKRFESALDRVFENKDTKEGEDAMLEYSINKALQHTAAKKSPEVSTGFAGCPLSFGKEYENPKINAGPWYEATKTEAAAAENDGRESSRHKVKNPETGEYDANLVTTEGKRCIRDDPRDIAGFSRGTFTKGILEKLRLLKDVMEKSTNHKQRRRGAVNTQIRKLANQVSSARNQRKYGSRVQFKSNKHQCDPLHEHVGAMFEKVVGTPQEIKIGGITPTPLELSENTWHRGFGVGLDDGSAMCLSGHDSLLDQLKMPDYHHLDDLRRVYDNDDGSYPLDEKSSRKKPLDEVYMTSAFCAQKHTKEDCESNVEAPFPGTTTNKKPSDYCAMHTPEFGRGEGVCMPKFVSDQWVPGISPPGGIPTDKKIGEFYETFRRAEREIQSKVYRKGDGSASPGGGYAKGALNRFSDTSPAVDKLKRMLSAMRMEDAGSDTKTETAADDDMMARVESL